MPKAFDGRKVFVPGFEGVGLEIVSVISPTERLEDRSFRVRYDCCGQEGEMKYSTLYWRFKEERKDGTVYRCRDCAQQEWIKRGHQSASLARTKNKPKPAHLKYRHLRSTALRMLAKGTVAHSEVDDWLEIPRGTTAHWLRESGQKQPPRIETYRIADPVLSLALSGAWR